jgi:DNA-binding transcriptional LysR family regulator
VGINWDDLRFVLALRRAGSLGAAARLLKVESSTVSRRLSSIEEALGVQLAAQLPGGLQLNEAGITVADLAEGIDGRIDELTRRIRNTVRVRLVMDALAALFERERTMLDGASPM